MFIIDTNMLNFSNTDPMVVSRIKTQEAANEFIRIFKLFLQEKQKQNAICVFYDLEPVFNPEQHTLIIDLSAVSSHENGCYYFLREAERFARKAIK